MNFERYNLYQDTQHLLTEIAHSLELLGDQPRYEGLVHDFMTSQDQHTLTNLFNFLIKHFLLLSESQRQQLILSLVGIPGLFILLVAEKDMANLQNGLLDTDITFMHVTAQIKEMCWNSHTVSYYNTTNKVIYSYEFALAQTGYGLDLVATKYNALVNSKHEQPSTLLHIMSHLYEGNISLAYVLLANNWRVAPQFIDESAFNALLTIPNLYNTSVAFLFAKKNFFIDDSIIVQDKINEHALNAITATGESLAFWISVHQTSILCANECKLGTKITGPTLNQVISSERHKGESLAFSLVSDKYEIGMTVLKHAQFSLASLISNSTFNQIVKDGAHQGKSVAFSLARYFANQSIPIDPCYCLLFEAIDYFTLNHILTDRDYKGESTAFWLAHDPLFLQQNSLAKKISTRTMNQVLPGTNNAGKSVAFCLAKSKVGIYILSEQNYALGKKIKYATAKSPVQCVNQQKNIVNESVYSLLFASAQGQQILKQIPLADSQLSQPTTKKPRHKIG